MKKLVSLLLAAMMLTGIVAMAEVPEGYPAIVEEMIQSEHKTITIYDYWSGEGKRADEPTEEQQAQYDYQDWIEATYNVKIVQKQGGDWNTCAEEMTNFTAAPDDSMRAYIIEPGKVGNLINGGIAAPIDYDFSADKWNKVMIDMWTVNGKPYALATGKTDPAALVYFNKRVLEEAGIDWNTIYDMQAAGTWTWEVWEEMLKATTRDTNNDGVIDIYGVVGSDFDMYNLAVFSNGGCYFDFDENGNLYPAMNSEETIIALNWARDEIRFQYWRPQPDGANWDWYIESWKTGANAFYVQQAYAGFNDNSEMADMEDEWGAVAFPVPNAGDPYKTVVASNMTMIPNCYDAETVKMITFFYDLWTNPTPGYDDEFAWIGNKYNYTDERAVDETYAMLREEEHSAVMRVAYVGNHNDVLGPLLWNFGWSTPAELIESNMPAWQSLCDSFNAR